MRSKHTDQPTASQGLKTYMVNCAASGLPHVRAKAARFEALPKAERMAAYLAEFGTHFQKSSKVNAPKEVNDISTVLTSEQIEALVALGLMEAPASPEAASVDTSDWKKGVRFSFTAQNGNVREHEVTRVAKGRVYTDQGQDFSIEKALCGYAADRVTIL